MRATWRPRCARGTRGPGAAVPGLWPGMAAASCILNVCDFLLVAPDTINNHVKTCREEQKNLHFFAPEYGGTVQPLCWPY